MHVIGHMIFGLIVGIVAKWIFPGHQPGGIIVTMILGIVGAWLGGLIGRALGWYGPGHPAGFIMAVVGALIVLYIYHLVAGSGRMTAFQRHHPTMVAASQAFPPGAPSLSIFLATRNASSSDCS
jgi:uncharacterized membrane protein YeaQ/YmgE (transglycosylase-associated protein family)